MIDAYRTASKPEIDIDSFSSSIESGSERKDAEKSHGHGVALGKRERK